MKQVSYIILFAFLGLFFTIQAGADQIFIENSSFELPVIDPNGYPAVPFAAGWTELDLDQYSSNTGVFLNTAPNSPDHIVNADGKQLAFLGSAEGNGFEQDLESTYKTGCDYRFTVGLAISNAFPPSQEEPVDTLELALYYRDSNDPNLTIDIATRTVDAAGLLSTQLQDFSLYLDTVPSDANYVNKNIGVAIRATGEAGGFWDLDNVRLVESLPVSIKIENSSFELPVIDPNGYPAVPFAAGWTELDLDQYSSNTGVFLNTSPNSPDHIVNADGKQLAFLGSAEGNGFEQDLESTYKTGCDYRFTVGLAISNAFPPSQEEPVDTLELALYYRDSNDPNLTIDIATRTVDAAGLLSTQLQDFSLYLDTVPSDANYVNKNIGVAIRATGEAGGFWDLDNVRLAGSFPSQISEKEGKE